MQSLDIRSIYKSLRRNAFNAVTAYQSDWKHDRQALRNALEKLTSGEINHVEFVHVATNTGTHLWFVEIDNLDVVVKILFGKATPREHMRNIAGIFAPTSMSIPDGAIIQHFDGTSVNIIDRAAARRIFLDAAAAPRQGRDATRAI